MTSSQQTLKGILTKKQIKAFSYLIDNTRTQILYGGGAGGGKSFLLCMWLFNNCFNYPGSRWVMGRSKLKRLKETTLNTFFEIGSRYKWNHLYKYNQQDGIVRFKNGSEILLKDLIYKPHDPNFDDLGSLEITGAIVDECNQIMSKAKDILFSRIRYKIDEFGLMPKIAMSCNPAKNWTYKEFYKPFRSGDLPKDKAFIQALVKDNPFISKHYVESLKSIKDKATKERLWKGNWEYDDDPAALIEYESIVDLYDNIHVTEQSSKRYMTADVALKGSDLLVVGVWHGFVLIDVQTMPKSGGKEILDLINRLRKKHRVPPSNIVYDADGVGGFLGGSGGFIPGAKPFVNNSRPLKYKGQEENYASLKDQCGYHVADRINKGELYLKYLRSDTHTQEIVNEELQEIKNKDPLIDGKLKLKPKKEIKEDIGRSPDYADMILMREYFELDRSKIPQML
jgi:phage terminase large subunit